MDQSSSEIVMPTNGNWSHQERGKLHLGRKRLATDLPVVGVAPPGAGKSRVMFQLIAEEVAAGGKVVLYTHRTALLEQLDRLMTEQGIDHGIIASGYQPEFDHAVQLASIDTVFARCVTKGLFELHDASLVLFDEAHAQTGTKARAVVYGSERNGIVMSGHLAAGAFVVGFTATPVDMGGFYGDMVAFGSYSELRDCGAHLPVTVYSPSEIDCRGLNVNASNEYSSAELEPRAKAIIGSAFDNWKTLNPSAYPALLFGPSVPCAMWFAWEWVRRGVPAAFLGGEVCLLPGRLPDGTLTLVQEKASREVRDAILAMSKSGEVAIVTNRFVLREAIDMPWIYHGIGATVFGGIATFLQSVGRIQRNHPAYTKKVWQCHGGSYWRHGSPNENRVWEINSTNKAIAKLRAMRAATGDPDVVEGICCPQCTGWRKGGTQCPHCGFMHKRSVRMVQQLDGELIPMTGRVNPKRGKSGKNSQQLWMKTLWAASFSGKTVASAREMWRKRCMAEGIDADVNMLKPAIPDREILWHKPVAEVWPWLGKRKGAAGGKAKD